VIQAWRRSRPAHLNPRSIPPDRDVLVAALRSSSLRIDQQGDTFELSPSMRDRKSAFEPVAKHQRTLESPADAELGRIVIDELAFALPRDGTG
jgi:hypothetical protein